jgi:hypothetical protein
VALAKKVLIEVSLGNAEMKTAADVSHAVQTSIANWAAYDGAGADMLLRVGYGRKIRDINGNVVGQWEVVEA